MQVTTLGERPDLERQVRDLDQQAWPAFMYHVRGWKQYWENFFTDFPDFQIVLVDDDQRVIGGGHTVPTTWNATLAGLPPSWDATLEGAVQTHRQCVTCNALAGLSIIIAPEAQGKGYSVEVLKAMKQVAQQHGFEQVIVPVRPMLKPKYVLTLIERYVTWRREDGSHFDPWLRTHEKAGGEIVGVARESKVVVGSVAEWEAWTGMIFPESGTYIVPGALDVLVIDRERDQGRHAEPNVWVLHQA